MLRAPGGPAAGRPLTMPDVVRRESGAGQGQLPETLLYLEVRDVSWIAHLETDHIDETAPPHVSGAKEICVFTIVATDIITVNAMCTESPQ